jgi:hypothetical protein
MPHRREHALDRIRCPQMIPVPGGEVEEGEQRIAILRQAGDRLLVLGAVFVGEHIDRRLGCRGSARRKSRECRPSC